MRARARYPSSSGVKFGEAHCGSYLSVAHWLILYDRHTSIGEVTDDARCRWGWGRECGRLADSGHHFAAVIGLVMVRVIGVHVGQRDGEEEADENRAEGETDTACHGGPP